MADLAGRAASGAGQVAGQAAEIASSAREVAGPAVRVAAATASDKLSVAAERAAAMLADAAERLADAVPDGRLSSASQSVADSVRPKKRSTFKTLLVVAATAGGVVALLRSPLAARLRQRLFGAPDDDFDDEAESITLPVDSGAPSTATADAVPAAGGEAGISDAAAGQTGVGDAVGSEGNGTASEANRKSTAVPRPTAGS
ncbi:MAG: hypothetical protein ABR541_00105 [Candidatus Dormibacteria bacterium]